MRQNDVLALLSEVNTLIEQIKKAVADAIDNVNTESIMKPKIKIALEQLRSCLDYCAHDIYDYVIAPVDGLSQEQRDKINIYFPYGKTEAKFKDTIMSRSFKQLKELNEKVYILVESIQPHKTNSTWLFDLCTHTDYNKHNRFSEQSRVEGVNIGNAIRIDNKSTIYIKDSYIGGKRIDNMLVTNGKVFTDLVDINTIKFTKWASFIFKGTNIDIIKLIEDSYRNVFDFQGKLYKTFV
jgi:hypothetical protein